MDEVEIWKLISLNAERVLSTGDGSKGEVTGLSHINATLPKRQQHNSPRTTKLSEATHEAIEFLR